VNDAGRVGGVQAIGERDGNVEESGKVNRTAT
jgi:hypothetical protein